MVLWFAGLSFVLVWSVFRDPAVDYRLVVAGALLPDLIDLVVGGPSAAHALVSSTGLLIGVMLATRRRRQWRRRLLAVPVGTFLHLVLDGIWARTRVFWWPVFGTALGGRGLPSLDRPVGLVVAQEVAGVVALMWAWRRFGLSDPPRRTRFLTTGRLGREFRPGATTDTA